jgi:N-acetylglucosaminyldiphosphoundecaprenol N-acetyl-beta-D-mannosaminyltransferase
MIHNIFAKITSDFNYVEKNTIVSYVNVYSYSQLRKSPKLVSKIDKFTLDGILLLVLLRVLFLKKFTRLSPDFSSYFGEVFRLSEKENKKLFFVGASQAELDKFVTIIQTTYPSLNIVGVSNGFFELSEASKLISEIDALACDLVFIGLGTPKQEEFAVCLKESNFNGTIYTCGAFISQTAKRGVQYYPNFVNALHLRWLYRLFREKGLFKRYFIQYPYSTLLILKDYLNKKNK